MAAPEIATLPSGWRRRLKPLQVGRIRVLCLDLPDLGVSKLAAGRLKDLELVGALDRLGLCKVRDVRTRMRQLPSARDRKHVGARLQPLVQDLAC